MSCILIIRLPSLLLVWKGQLPSTLHAAIRREMASLAACIVQRYRVLEPLERQEDLLPRVAVMKAWSLLCFFCCAWKDGTLSMYRCISSFGHCTYHTRHDHHCSVPKMKMSGIARLVSGLAVEGGNYLHTMASVAGLVLSGMRRDWVVVSPHDFQVGLASVVFEGSEHCN